MTNKKDTKKTETKKVVSKKAETKTPAPKRNYKLELSKAEEQIKNLKMKVLELEFENAKNIDAFQEKAKGFSSKAQKEINKFKEDSNKSLEKEKSLVKKYGSQKMLEAILEPIINIELAIEAGKNQDAVKSYVIGFEMLINQFYSELEGFGFSKIIPKKGSTFNPELHHAISTKPDKKHINKILEIKKMGFKLHDRIVKPATVVIGK